MALKRSVRSSAAFIACAFVANVPVSSGPRFRGETAVVVITLAKAAKAAGIEFDSGQAHSAIYDAERTADLFCNIVNRWRDLTL